MVENQFAAGGVVVRKKEGKVEVLLIKDSYGHWIWPKGHIEEGETPQEAALREVREETGLNSLKIMQEIGRQEYYFTLCGKKIFKTVHIFLTEADPGEEVRIQTEEILDGKWLDVEEALSTIEYDGSKKILEKGIRIFKEAG